MRTKPSAMRPVVSSIKRLIKLRGLLLCMVLSLLLRGVAASAGESTPTSPIKTPAQPEVPINTTHDQLSENYHCKDCGGLGIPIVTTKRNKVICDACDGLGVTGLKHLPHKTCIDILRKQNEYLGKQDGVGDGSIRRVNTEIRREKDRQKKLIENYQNPSVKIIGSLEQTTQILKDIKGEVTRCNNAQNQQYEVEITSSGDDVEKKLESFYKLENTKYVKEDDTHYVYVQRQELTQAGRRRLTPTRRRLPVNYDALRPAQQALTRRRLMNRQTSHIVVLKRLSEDIKELNP